MKKSQFLMYEVINDRYNSLLTRVVNGDVLNEAERNELQQLYGDKTKFETEIMQSSQELLKQSQSNVDRLFKVNDEAKESFEGMKENFDTLHDCFEKVYKKSEENFYSYSLAEHFLIENELDQKFIDFLKDVAEKEADEDYKNAAKTKVDFYHHIYEGENYYHLDDEYGVVKEGREYDEYLKEESK